jgi:hypothetical protein
MFYRIVPPIALLAKVRFSLAPWILSPESLVDLQAIFYHRLLQMLSPFGLSIWFSL